MSENKEMVVFDPAKRTPVYTMCRVLACVAFHTVGPVQYYHAERIKDMKAPYIVIANHSSFFDPVIIANSIKKYEITYLGKKELASSKFAKWFLKKMHMITVDRHNMDMAAMRTCVKALRDGQILGIFPEGTRHHKGVMEEMESGVPLIALRSGATLIPVYIDRKYRFFTKTKCVIGEPIDYSDLKEQGLNKETCAALEERIKSTYQDFKNEFPFHGK